MENYLIILILAIILIIYLVSKNEEKYAVVKSETSKMSYSDILPQKGVRQGSDALDGMLFEDVNLFESEHTVGGELGVEKCIKKCDGMCVEFGMTSDAYCFPTDYAKVSDHYTRTIQSELGFRPI